MFVLFLLFIFAPPTLACSDNFVSGIPPGPPPPLEIEASLASYYWGRFVLYDLADNGELDASLIYNLDMQSGAYLNLTSANRIPLVCPGVPKLAPPQPYTLDDVACCGICSESEPLLALFTFLFREHNSYVRTARGTVDARYNAGRAHIVRLLRSSCPTCAALDSPDHILILLLALSTSGPSYTSPALGSLDPVLACSTLRTKNLTKIGRRITVEILNRTVCWDDLDPPPSTYIYSGNDILVSLLGEPHGPGEVDVLGPFSRNIFLETINASGPVWYTAFPGHLISNNCPSTSSSSSSDNITNGSMIFFVIVIGVLTLAFGIYIMITLGTLK